MSASNVLLFPAAPVVFELQSERFFELTRLLIDQGFKISNTGHVNRFRITDIKSDSDAEKDK